MAAKNATQKLLDMVGKFVTEHKGTWDHRAWEKAVEDAAKLGFDLQGAGQHYLGELLESTKFFYHNAPTAKSKTNPKAKAKAKTKAKTKAKAKAKTKAKPKAK